MNPVSNPKPVIYVIILKTMFEDGKGVYSAVRCKAKTGDLFP
jgi:hypothetical protein